MSIIIVGGGGLGSFLAGLMEERQEKVIVIEKNEMEADKIQKDLKRSIIVQGDACSPDVLKKAGIHEANIIVAVTGHDEDNLIVCQLAKFEYGVQRVIGRINNPKNEWLFTKDMGVDTFVSGARIIAKMLEEEAEKSKLSTILNLVPGEVSLVRSVIDKDAKVANKKVKDLNLPKECVVMALVRENNVLLANQNSLLLPGDEVLTAVTDECRKGLEAMLDEK